MKKFTLALLALLALLAFVPGAHAATVIGRLVTCPGGDPIVGAPVHLWFNGVWVNSATTGANGQYVALAGPGSCDPLNSMITVTIGSNLYTQYFKSHCPKGRHGTGANCCVQVAKSAGNCTQTVFMPDLELRCGTPGDPPCPMQQ